MTTRHIFFAQLALLLAFFGCGQPSGQEKSDFQEEEAQTEIQQSDESVSSETTNAVTADTIIHKQSNFNVDSIRKYTVALHEEVEFENDAYDNLVWIPENFLRQYITDRPIANGGEPLFVDYADSYKFYEFKEFKNFYLLSFLYRDESCCRFLYYLTLDKEPLKTIEICLVGYTGGDGGWVGDKLGNWSSKNRIKLTETSSYDPDFVNGPNLEQDTVWTEISLDEFGSFAEFEQRSVKYKGGRKIK